MWWWRESKNKKGTKWRPEHRYDTHSEADIFCLKFSRLGALTEHRVTGPWVRLGLDEDGIEVVASYQLPCAADGCDSYFPGEYGGVLFCASIEALMSNVEADLAIGMMGWTEIDGKWYCCEDGCPIFDSYFDCNGCGDVFPVADKRYEDGDETGDPFCTKCVD